MSGSLPPHNSACVPIPISYATSQLTYIPGPRRFFVVKARSRGSRRSVLLNEPLVPFVLERFERTAPAVVSVAHLW